MTNQVEEGDKCPNCGEGALEFTTEGDCSCHISAPCNVCTDSFLMCPVCHWDEGDR